MPAKFPPDARLRLKTALEERVLPRFGTEPEKQQSAAARKLGIDQSTISRILGNPSTGGSVQLVEKVADFLNESPARILLGASSGNEAKQLRELPGFTEALKAASQRASEEYLGLTHQELEAAADTRATPPPPRCTAGLLIHIALARHAPPESDTHHKRPRRRT